ncbi:hypothetical protein QVD99_008042 [Batrachochytrium dendrobatidis]|nr:hypothetical protein O5D80_004804 [Batrachochytrium dendrobatidis]KAK5665196.1 hypothetical protein QVD99_008042 [Batrachochytrium dendrobatidis]
MVGLYGKTKSAHKSSNRKSSHIKNPRKDSKPFKSTSRDAEDMYEEVDSDEDARKILARRGGGGGAVGRTLDDVGTIDFTVNEIDEEDDEELDDSEAFNSSDEEKYGIFFLSNKTKKTEKKTKKQDNSNGINMDETNEKSESEDSEDSEDDQADDGDYMDISDMLNQNGGSQTKPDILKSTLSEPSNHHKSINNQSEASSTFSMLLSNNSDYLGSDDENANSTDLHDIMYSDNNESDEDTEDLSKLSTFIQNMSNDRSDASRKRKRLPEFTEAFGESEFGLEAKSKSNTLHSRKKIELDDLVGVIDDDINFNNLKKQLEIHDREGKKQAVAAPLPHVVQDRLNRQAAYLEAKKEVSKWSAVVKKNREADSLSFPMGLSQTNHITSGALIGKFSPMTDLEKEIEQMLRESGLVEQKQKEMEELELNKISSKELIERQNELAKMRSLMFYKEQKQKRIAKIKSKTYHKIHKKKDKTDNLSVEELKKLDPEFAQDKIEQMELDRAKERMSLKHRNVGKWAKQILGKNDIDSESRQALALQLKKHDELKRRIRGVDSDDSDGYADLALDLDGKEFVEDAAEARRKGISQLDALDAEIRDEDNSSGKGLLSMKFMQRGLAQQKKEARELAQQARLDLEREEDENDGVVKPNSTVDKSQSDGNTGRKVFGPQSRSSGAKTLDFDDDNTEEFKMDVDMNLHSVRASGPVTIDFKTSTFKSNRLDVKSNNIPLEKSQKHLFKVESFDLEDEKQSTFVGDANKTKITALKPAAFPSLSTEVTKPLDSIESSNSKSIHEVPSNKSATKPNKLDKTSSENQHHESDDDGANPWLTSVSETAVQKSLSGAHSHDRKINKANKAQAKLSQQVRETRKVLNEHDNDDDSLELEGLEDEKPATPTPNTHEPSSFASNKKNASSTLSKQNGTKFTSVVDDSETDSDVEARAENARPAMVHKLHATALNQVDLMRMAFANDDVLTDFQEEKKRITMKDEPVAPVEVPGWGSWSGPGLLNSGNSKKNKHKKGDEQKGSKKTDTPTAATSLKSGPRRADSDLSHVIINTKAMSKVSKYVLPELPHGFYTSEQYERMIQMPLGREWNTQSVHGKLVKPRVQTKLGTVIQPPKLLAKKSTTKKNK